MYREWLLFNLLLDSFESFKRFIYETDPSVLGLTKDEVEKIIRKKYKYRFVKGD